jgi:RND superfamily putative drug exporter
LAQQTLALTLLDLRRVALAVVVVELLLLIMFLRALIAPLYLMAASILALTASFGLTTYVFYGAAGRRSGSCHGQAARATSAR